MKKTTHQIEDEFREQTKKGLPHKQKKTLEEIFERILWDKEEEPEKIENEWI